MDRTQCEAEIRETLGEVPVFFESLPDDALVTAWQDFKSFQLPDTELSGKTKQLIGLGVSAATYCPYCAYFHEKAARLLGATDAEIEESIRMAAETRRWSTYIHGLQLDMGEFRRQTDRMTDYVKRAQTAQRAA
jgi:AhpD family alkylhydroperoxidase